MTLRLLSIALLGACTGNIKAPPTSSVSADPVCSVSPKFQSVTVHRLNRTEYNNTVQALLGTTSKPADAFPADARLQGFENNSDALTVTPLLFDAWEVAAQELAAEAIKGFFIKCDPAKVGKDACARDTLKPFLRKAYRRPPTDAELQQLVNKVAEAQTQGDSFQRGMELAITSVLLSPKFLYRSELPADPSQPNRQLSGFELASRLSYFLWSSMPDDVLLDAAESGQLSTREQVAAQVDRMLSAPQSAEFFNSLATQWLPARTLKTETPYGYEFDEELKESIFNETRLFIKAFAESNLKVVDLLDAPFTFLNERLAKHYGVPNITGAQFQRVDTTAFPQRGGLLTQATILAGTSVRDDTSVVTRGQWVLSEFLCSSPPPPPDDVKTEEPKATGTTTKRQVLEQHRANEACASCHRVMDPIGFGLENYDVAGVWREKIDGLPIDASGELFGGKSFAGPREMFAALKEDPRFNPCFSKAVFRYALGRTLFSQDQCAVETAVNNAVARGGRFRELISEIATSDMFRFQGTEINP